MSEATAARPIEQAPVTGEAEPRVAARRRVVGVQFRRAAGIIHDYDASDLALRHDDRVVVETERGEELGWAVGQPEEREPVLVEGRLRRVLRVADASDLSRERDARELERQALRWSAARSRDLQLGMKMIAAEWSHSRDKVTFFFSSDDRVDFRGLVREAAQRFRSRIEMRQIGPRDQAKIVGALGPCGRETCCSSWLRGFSPVSIRMAKDQGLALNPQKVAGVCGRLLCCLAYEQETYRSLRRALPRVGKQVTTPRGSGRVVDVHVLLGRVRVVLDAGESIELLPAEIAALSGIRAEAETEEEPLATEGEDLLPDEAPAPAPAAPAGRPPAGRPSRPAAPSGEARENRSDDAAPPRSEAGPRQTPARGETERAPGRRRQGERRGGPERQRSPERANPAGAKPAAPNAQPSTAAANTPQPNNPQPNNGAPRVAAPRPEKHGAERRPASSGPRPPQNSSGEARDRRQRPGRPPRPPRAPAPAPGAAAPPASAAPAPAAAAPPTATPQPAGSGDGGAPPSDTGGANDARPRHRRRRRGGSRSGPGRKDGPAEP